MALWTTNSGRPCAALAGAVFLCGCAVGNPITPETLGRHDVPEGSGIAASRRYPGVFWVIGDSDAAPYLYAIRPDGTRLKQVTVKGAANVDWEDIAVDGDGSIWIGDIGDNPPCTRADFKLYRVREPDPYDTATECQATAYRFAYPDGGHDAEALFLWNGVPYIVEKKTDTEIRARIYKFPEPLDAASEATLELIAEFDNEGNRITGADISADGRRLALVADNADKQWVLVRRSDSTRIADFIEARYWQWTFEFPNEQGEAICFGAFTHDVYVLSEQGGFWRVSAGVYEALSPMPPEADVEVTLTRPEAGAAAGSPVRFACSATAYGTTLRRIELRVLHEAHEVAYVPADAAWRYRDDGIDLPDEWTESGYDDRAWNSGRAPLGFGTSEENAVVVTQLAKGTPAPATYYFRRTFVIAPGESPVQLTLTVDFDDGVIAYVNGGEVLRANVANAAHATWAAAVRNWSRDGSAPQAPIVLTFGAAAMALLRTGENTLAIEVHQQSATSSDLMMAASLTGTTPAEQVVTEAAEAAGVNQAVDFTVALDPGPYLWDCAVFDAEGIAHSAAAGRPLRVVGLEFLRGDGNGDRRVDLSDAIYVLRLLFGTGVSGVACEDSLDANDDGVIDLADACEILGVLFAGFPAMPEPYPQPGFDGTADRLLCP